MAAVTFGKATATCRGGLDSATTGTEEDPKRTREGEKRNTNGRRVTWAEMIRAYRLFSLGQLKPSPGDAEAQIMHCIFRTGKNGISADDLTEMWASEGLVQTYLTSPATVISPQHSLGDTEREQQGQGI
uniref:Uncharacterized protein n=1 Tax=Oryza punctata TaxID=4537 RepID=A0A0E0JWZ4_ORYPU